MKQMNVLLLFGGESSEHDVSINSARTIFEAIDTAKYQIYLTYIDRTGRWWLLDGWHQDFDHVDETNAVQLAVVPGGNGIITIQEGTIFTVDVIFPVLHGKYGEDGTVQGLAELAHIPIVGCGLEASALAMDKHATKQLLRNNNIAVVDWIMLEKDRAIPTEAELVASCGGAPWFVKPARSGSSVGVSKVMHYEQLETALRLAFLHDSQVLVERSIAGRELEVAVLGNPPQQKASGVGEIIPGADFYDYDDKYAANSTSQAILEAQLTPEQAEAIRTTALRAYQTIGCRGLARVDFLLDQDGTVYLNEINTLPGFTSSSMYPKLWQASGHKLRQLINQLIKLAIT